MQRIYPSAPVQQNPVGFDEVMVYYQLLFSNLMWSNHKSFGRAYEQPFNNAKNRVPKIYQGGKEYYDPLPHDALDSYSFLMARSPERRVDEEGLERDVSVVFWFDLRKVLPGIDNPSVESLRLEVEQMIKESMYVGSINGFYDERIEDIFFGYIEDELLEDNQYLMFPYAGFRIDFVAAYPVPCGPPLDNLIMITRSQVPLDWILLKIDDRVAKLHLAYDGDTLITELTEI